MMTTPKQIKVGSTAELLIASQPHVYLITEEEEESGDVSALPASSTLGRLLLGRAYPDQFRCRLADGQVVAVEITDVKN